MDIVRESVFYAILCRFGRLLSSGVLGGAWLWLSGHITEAVRRSNLYRLLTEEGPWRRLWRSSVLCAFFGWLLDLIPRGLRKLETPREGRRTSSLLAWALDGLAEKRSVLLGLFVLLMLCVPYKLWNNLYAALGSVALFGLYYFWAVPRRGVRRVEPAELSPFYFVFLLCAALAFLFSEHRGLSLRFVIFHVACAFLVFTVMGSVETVRQLRALLYTVLAGLLVAALYGCVQIVTGVEFYSYQLDMSINSGITGRIYSFFSNPNNFHTFITMLLPFALGLLVGEKSFRGRLFCVAVLAVTLAASLATYSRSGWIGLLAAVVVFLLLTDWRYLLLLPVLGILALPFLPASVVTRLTTIGNMNDSSARYRVQIYTAFGRLLKLCWPTGVGLGTDTTYAALHELPPMADGNYALHSHNNYMQLCAEMGIVGAGSYTFALLGRLKNSFAAARKADRGLRPLLAAAAGSMTGIMLMGLVDYTWYYPRSMFVFWFLFGVLTVCCRLARADKKGDGAHV